MSVVIFRRAFAARGQLRLRRRAVVLNAPASFSSTNLKTPQIDPQTQTPRSPTQESVLYVLKKLGKHPDKALTFFNSATADRGFLPGAAAYDLLLRTLAGHKDFWSILRRMEDDGHAIGEDTYAALISAFKSQNLAADAAALADFRTLAAARSLTENSVRSIAETVVKLDPDSWKQKIDLDLDLDLVVRVIREVRDHPARALAFFRWAGELRELGAEAYNAVARVLCRREETSGEIGSFLREMKTKGHDVDIDTYVKLLRLLLRGKKMREAVELYEMMMDGPYKPAAQDAGVLLRQLASGGEPDLELVGRVARKYESAGFSLSKVVYDGICRSLASAARFDDASAMMEKMRREGFEPDNISYSQLVHGFCKARRLEDARRVLDEMSDRGCIPDVKTWTVLIQGHFAAGEAGGALECLTKMLESGSAAADGDLLDVVVKGLCRDSGRVSAAHNLFVEMTDRARVKPWQATFKHLIQELLRQKKLEEALKLLASMKAHKFPPFADPFPACIAGFGTTADAAEFLKALTGNTYPTSAAYLKVFTAFVDEGRYSEAQDLLFKSPHHIRNHKDICNLFGSAEPG